MQNRRGLHARAAAKFASVAEQFQADVNVTYDGQTVSALSIMGLMMLGAATGSELLLIGVGAQALEALEALSDLVQGKFNEIE